MENLFICCAWPHSTSRVCDAVPCIGVFVIYRISSDLICVLFVAFVCDAGVNCAAKHAGVCASRVGKISKLFCCQRNSNLRAHLPVEGEYSGLPLTGLNSLVTKRLKIKNLAVPMKCAQNPGAREIKAAHWFIR